MAVRPGAPARSQRWPRWVLWKLGSFIFLILLETIDCSANPSYLPDNNHNPSVNIYMSLEEVKKLLGKAAAGLPLARGSSRSVPPPLQPAIVSLARTHTHAFRFGSLLKHLTLATFSDPFDKVKVSPNLFSNCSF